MTDFLKIWHEIEWSAKSNHGWTVRRLFPETPFGIQAGRRAGDHAEGLLFEIANRSLPTSVNLPDCAGFNVHMEPIDVGPGGRSRLCLVIKDRRYLEVFATLAQDISSRVISAANEAAAVRIFLARLNTWRKFLERFGLDKLTDAQLAGLFAELHILESKLLPMLGTMESVRSWRGPFGDPHDFRSGRFAIEVKATTVQAAISFMVSNLAQLDRGESAKLSVCHCELGLNPDAGISVPELVARIRTHVIQTDPGAATELDECLLEAGYLDLHADAYRDRKFSIRHERWFDVQEGFPRLISTTVPSGVISARYSVALSDCTPFEIDWNEVRRDMEVGVL